MKPTRPGFSITLWAPILIALSIIAVIVATLRTAATPYIVKGLMAAGGAALFLITLLEDILRAPALHELMWHAYAIVFIAYMLQWLESAIVNIDSYVQTKREVVIARVRNVSK